MELVLARLRCPLNLNQDATIGCAGSNPFDRSLFMNEYANGSNDLGSNDVPSSPPPLRNSSTSNSSTTSFNGSIPNQTNGATSASTPDHEWSSFQAQFGGRALQLMSLDSSPSETIIKFIMFPNTCDNKIPTERGDQIQNLRSYLIGVLSPLKHSLGCVEHLE